MNFSFIARVFAISLVLPFFTVSCAERRNLSPLPSISSEAKEDLEKSVNCRTAEKDIAVLEEEKASVLKQVASGVRSVLPVAVVAGILMGDYRDRVAVASGKYNRDIEAKISEIKTQCQL